MTPVAFLRYRLRLAQNTQGIITTWNAGAQRIKGFKEEEAVGQHLRISFPEPYQKEGKPEREIEQARQQGTYKAEDWRRCKDGSLFWAKVVLTAVHGIFRKQVN